MSDEIRLGFSLGPVLSLRQKEEFRWCRCSSIMEMLVLLCTLGIVSLNGERSFEFF